MTTPARWIVGNLDVEARAAGQHLPERVLDRLSAAATLLRAFADPGTGLWTPTPVDPQRVLPVEGLERPVLAAGEQTLPPSEGGHRCWCRHDARPFLSRAVDVALMTDLGLLRPGVRLLHTMDGFADAVAAHPEQAWVLKPLLSAAGRGQIHGHGDRLADGTPAQDAPAVRRLLDPGPGQGGGALYEPWLNRRADFGCVGEIHRGGQEDGTVSILGLHRALVDARGAFGGVELSVDGAPPEDLREPERAALEDTTRRAGAWLAHRGLRGPFGVDAFRCEDEDGADVFVPLCELNARLSFGRVARALVDRIAPHAGWTPTDTVRLRFGKGPFVTPAAPTTVPLLASDTAGGDDTCAWLDVLDEPSRRGA